MTSIANRPSLLRSVFVTAAVALALGASSLARPQTTQPSQFLTILVVEYDSYLRMGVFAATATHDGLIEVGTNIPRGDYVSINIINKGKRAHDFKIFGKKTGPIKPGHKAHLFVTALIRGSYPYGSTLDKGKAFHGFVNVV
jgi:hypothetical protein